MTEARRRARLLGIALLTGAGGASAGDPDEHVMRDVWWTRAAGVAAVTLWGTTQWQYFERSPRVVSEGWFGARTDSGGADKLGHLHTSYFITHALADLYEHRGLGRAEAGRQAALTSLLVMGYMEFGDSFSARYGFSVEDMAMNAAGAMIGHWLYADPAWRRRVDLRVEYEPRGLTDPFTDYGNIRYLVALKLDGFPGMQATPFEWLEIHAGYFARGYDDVDSATSRNLYAGVGINFSRLLRRGGFKRTSRVLDYLQPPQTTLAFTYTLSP